MRLTKKLGNVYINNIPNKEKLDLEERKNESIRVTNSIYEKIDRIEDIEDELGIDLITLIKALKDSMWFKHYDKEYNQTWIWDAHCYMKPLLNVYNKTIEIKQYVDNAGGYWFVDKDVVYLKDYGITWALTKEELENE